MPPPPTPIGAERLSQLTQKESYVFVIALNPSRLFLYPSYFMHCTHCEGVGQSCISSIPVGGNFFTPKVLKGSASLPLQGQSTPRNKTCNFNGTFAGKPLDRMHRTLKQNKKKLQPLLLSTYLEYGYCLSTVTLLINTNELIPL